MSSSYSDVAERLLLYRKKLRLTQAEMGNKLGVSQSHYYKLETGSKIISMHSLKVFMEHGENVMLLLTGENVKNGCMDQYFKMCRTRRGKIELYKLLTWLINQGIKLQRNMSEDIPEQYYKEIRVLESGLYSLSIWECIRAVERITQVEMAKLLDINIKRYRRIEKGESDPDAEILAQLYNRLRYSPMIFLNQDMFYEEQINKVWESFSDSLTEKLEPVVQKAIKLINEYESER